MKQLKIIFMGTPEFAVPSLTALNKTEHDIIAVVTQPDRPKGRGKKILPGPVKEKAQSLNLQILQPDSINSKEFISHIKSLTPDLLIVVAFGQLLSESLLAVPKIGPINVHPSLLPKYRGPAPVQWSLINGDKITGVSTMFLNKKLDAGDILLSIETKIDPEENYKTLHDRLAIIGADILIETIKSLQSNSIIPKPQNDKMATYAPLLQKKHGLIDWNKDSKKINDLIRGMTPWPGAYTFLNNKRLKIFKSIPIAKDSELEPGIVIDSFSNEIIISCGKGTLSLLEIQSESGKRLNVEDFLRGNKIIPGIKLKNS